MRKSSLVLKTLNHVVISVQPLCCYVKSSGEDLWWVSFKLLGFPLKPNLFSPDLLRHN